MTRRAFVTNLIAWGIVLVACAGYWAWSHVGDADATYSLVISTTPLRFMAVFSSALLEYSVGAVAGTLLVWLRKIELSKMALRVMRGFSTAFLLALFVGMVPLFTGGGVNFATLVLVWLGLALPPLVVAWGVLWALGFAGEKTEPPAGADDLAA